MNIALIGYGKMGKAIEQAALDRGHHIIARIGRSNQSELDQVANQADVAIEFSTPESAFDNIKKCLELGITTISGTTGWLDRKAEIDQLCSQREGTFLYASNFSIGVNLFFKINEYAAKLMSKFEQYDISMEEIHHVHKKDSPSGTAITLAEGIVKEHPQKESWKEMEGNGEVPKNVIPILSKRDGEVPGTHIINYSSSIDTINLKHEAHSREGFALGSVLVAEWIAEKEGIYTMDDFMNG